MKPQPMIDLTVLREKIYYQSVVPIIDLPGMTPFQGFSRGLMAMLPVLATLPVLPADIQELTIDPLSRLVRRRAGFGSWIWSPINVEALVRDGQPTAFMPFKVIFTAAGEIEERVSAWLRELPIKPLHVSLLLDSPALPLNELTVDAIKHHCLNVAEQLRTTVPESDVAEMQSAITAWQKPIEQRPSTLRFHSHNVTAPNEMVLASAGEAAPTGETGHLKLSPPEDYITGIRESTLAVLSLVSQTQKYIITPPKPDVILFAPATVRGIERELQKKGGHSSPEAHSKGTWETDRIYNGTICSIGG